MTTRISFIALAFLLYGLTRVADMWLDIAQFQNSRDLSVAVVEAERMERNNRPTKLRNQVRLALNLRAKGLLAWERISLANAIVRYSSLHGHDPLLLLAVIETESSYRKKVVSNVGAVGLMQVRPFVAKGLAHEMNANPKVAQSLYDPETNVRVGAYYLAKLLRRFDGDLTAALEAYNQGPTSVARSIRNGRKLRAHYSRRVLKARDNIRRVFLPEI